MPHLKIEPIAVFILQELVDHGYQAYLVGGAVRDLLIHQFNRPPASRSNDSTENYAPDELSQLDYDIATNATPDQIQQVFPESFYENQFGTVSLTTEHAAQLAGLSLPVLTFPPTRPKIIDYAQATKLHQSLVPPESQPQPPKLRPNLEITTFRSEGVYQDHRRPSQVSWGPTIEADLARRDFTINAMALRLLTHFDITTPHPLILANADYSIMDPYQGLSDLRHKIIKTVGHPPDRFAEDALRLLRAVRLSVQLGYAIEPTTLAAIHQQASLIAHISAERIRDELLKILASAQPALGIKLLDQTQLLPQILPELLATKNVKQGGHHATDVWIHSLDSLQWCPSSDPIVRLATLLHDIAKPQTQSVSSQNISFYNHEVIGSRMAYQIAHRLRLSKHDCQRIFTLVRYHMFHYQPHDTDAAIRRFMRQVGLNNLDDILDLREADRLGSGASQTSWRLEEMKQRMIEQLHQPLEIKDLAVNGHDLREHFKLEPGPVYRKILQHLFEQVFDQPELNKKEKLLELTTEYLQSATRSSPGRN